METTHPTARVTIWTGDISLNGRSDSSHAFANVDSVKVLYSALIPVVRSGDVNPLAMFANCGSTGACGVAGTANPIEEGSGQKHLQGFRAFNPPQSA
jgi:hypothetical protein